MRSFLENLLMTIIGILCVIAAIVIGVFGVSIIFTILGFICVGLMVVAIVFPIVNGVIELLDYLDRKKRKK